MPNCDIVAYGFEHGTDDIRMECRIVMNDQDIVLIALFPAILVTNGMPVGFIAKLVLVHAKTIVPLFRHEVRDLLLQPFTNKLMMATVHLDIVLGCIFFCKINAIDVLSTHLIQTQQGQSCLVDLSANINDDVNLFAHSESAPW